MTNQTVVAQAISPVTFEQKNAAYECGQRMAKNKLEVIQIATDYARALGTTPSYDQWEALRIDWVNGHAHANPDLTGNAHDQAWLDFAKNLDSFFGLTKPSSTNLAAVKKATEREVKTTKLLEKYEDIDAGTLRAQLAQAYQTLAVNPENKDAKKTQAELTKVIKVKSSEENKAHGEALKAKRAEVREAVGKCTDIDQLETALDILSGGFEINYSE
jgi:hypothetical protein